MVNAINLDIGKQTYFGGSGINIFFNSSNLIEEGEREKESWVTLASNVGTAGTALCEAALVAQQHCVSVSWLDNEWHWGFVRDLSPLCTASLQCQC